jgi:hypothetical protein
MLTALMMRAMVTPLIARAMATPLMMRVLPKFKPLPGNEHSDENPSNENSPDIQPPPPPHPNHSPSSKHHNNGKVTSDKTDRNEKNTPPNKEHDNKGNTVQDCDESETRPAKDEGNLSENKKENGTN